MRISDWSSDVCSSDLRIADVANLDVEYGSDLRPFAQELTAIACDEAPFGSIRHVAAKPEGHEFDQRVNGLALFQQLIVAFIGVERDFPGRLGISCFGAGERFDRDGVHIRNTVHISARKSAN